MNMPTTEDNARALAARKGYSLEVRGGHIRILAAGRAVHRAERWSEALKFIIGAPRLDDDGGAAA